MTSIEIGMHILKKAMKDEDLAARVKLDGVKPSSIRPIVSLLARWEGLSVITRYNEKTDILTVIVEKE